MNIKFFIGPMTKNVVDSVMEYCKEQNVEIGFIPSRRQVAIDCGYVNNWSTKSFKEYIGDHFVVRDHGGPGQGKDEDDGIKCLIEDCKHFNLLHIDPWKKYPRYEDGLAKTIELINICHSVNEDILFEVGTEESIRRFESKEIDKLLIDLREKLSKREFENIKYCVIQSGTSLKENHNTGEYDRSRLVEMCNIVKKHGKSSKEHNGDYLPISLVKEKFDLGLDSINIAPEFGQIETKIYIEAIKKQKPELMKVFWQLCYDSGKWKKWVDKNFSPERDVEVLINICGHYVFSSSKFESDIKSNLKISDEEIKNKIKQKIRSLFGA